MARQAYNPDWAFNAAVRAQAARWQRQQQLSAPQLTAIETAYPLDYYRPAWPLRVGLFLFAWLGLGMSGGFAFMIVGNSVFASALLYCAACFGVLELLIRDRHFYHAGADNALLYSGVATAVGLIVYVAYTLIWPVHLDEHFTLSYTVLPLLLIVAVLLAAVLRYADALVTAVAFFAALLLVGIVSVQVPLGLVLLPFLVMGAAAGALALHRALVRRVAAAPRLAAYYATCLLVLKALGLVVFYLGGNYLVVREGNAALHHLSGSVQVPFAPVFYAFTAGIPLLYIALGLRRADRPALLVGLLALAFSLYTLRHYRTLLPPEMAAVIAGAALTLLAGTLLRVLRPARFGLTSLPDDEPRYFDLENLVQAQTAHAPSTPIGGFEFGGGHSGGGGATGQF